MIGLSHLTIGIAAGMAIASNQNADIAHTALFIALSGIGALVPDIDTPNSKISRKLSYLRLLYAVPFFWNRHRGLSHSLLILAPLCLAAGLSHNIYLAVFTFGYASHIVADMMTRQGAPLFYPSSDNWHVLPYPLRLSTGGIIEKLILLCVIFFILLMLLKSLGIDLTSIKLPCLSMVPC